MPVYNISTIVAKLIAELNYIFVFPVIFHWSRSILFLQLVYLFPKQIQIKNVSNRSSL